jgi:hypothetical protein
MVTCAHPHPVPIQANDLSDDALLRHVVKGQLEGHRVLGHIHGLHPLPTVETSEAGDKALDDERSARAEHSGHVAEALGLPFPGAQSP